MDAMTSGVAGPDRPGQRRLKLQAQFWRSPFAVAAAAVLMAQTVLILAAALKGAALSYEITMSLTAVSATLLAAGIWPGWNYLVIDEHGLDQQAGLRGVRVAWPEVQQIRAFDGWAELRILRGQGGRFAVRNVPIFNRYDLTADAFAELIEGAWTKSRGQAPV